MRILVVGAGATGGYFGGRLAQAGRDVTFLLRERRAQHVRTRGLEIVSPHGNATVHPQTVSAEKLRNKPETFDLIVISTKSYQLASAMDDIAPAVGPGTLLLPILNGMRQLAMLAERFGADHVLGGSVRIVADIDAEGRVCQETTLGELNYGEIWGEPSRERTERLMAVQNTLQGAGFGVYLQGNMLATLWQKWWILASLGSICILGRGAIGEVAAAPQGPELARAVVAECTAIAAANGYPANEAMLADHIKRVTEAGSPLTSSMYRDMIKGAPVEADHILGDLLDRAKGVAAPLLTAAYVQLKVYEGSRKG